MLKRGACWRGLVSAASTSASLQGLPVRWLHVVGIRGEHAAEGYAGVGRREHARGDRCRRLHERRHLDRHASPRPPVARRRRKHSSAKPSGLLKVLVASDAMPPSGPPSWGRILCRLSWQRGERRVTPSRRAFGRSHLNVGPIGQRVLHSATSQPHPQTKPGRDRGPVIGHARGRTRRAGERRGSKPAHWCR